LSEWYVSQKKTSKNLLKLLQKYSGKANLSGKELTKEEKEWLAKLEAVAE
jgi:hypothetical protein